MQRTASMEVLKDDAQAAVAAAVEAAEAAKKAAAEAEAKVQEAARRGVLHADITRRFCHLLYAATCGRAAGGGCQGRGAGSEPPRTKDEALLAAARGEEAQRIKGALAVELSRARAASCFRSCGRLGSSGGCGGRHGGGESLGPTTVAAFYRACKEHRKPMRSEELGLSSPMGSMVGYDEEKVSSVEEEAKAAAKAHAAEAVKAALASAADEEAKAAEAAAKVADEEASAQEAKAKAAEAKARKAEREAAEAAEAVEKARQAKIEAEEEEELTRTMSEVKRRARMIDKMNAQAQASSTPGGSPRGAPTAPGMRSRAVSMPSAPKSPGMAAATSSPAKRHSISHTTKPMAKPTDEPPTIPTAIPPVAPPDEAPAESDEGKALFANFGFSGFIQRRWSTPAEVEGPPPSTAPPMRDRAQSAYCTTSAAATSESGPSSPLHLPKTPEQSTKTLDERMGDVGSERRMSSALQALLEDAGDGGGGVAVTETTAHVVPPARGRAASTAAAIMSNAPAPAAPDPALRSPPPPITNPMAPVTPSSSTNTPYVTATAAAASTSQAEAPTAAEEEAEEGAPAEAEARTSYVFRFPVSSPPPTVTGGGSQDDESSPSGRKSEALVDETALLAAVAEAEAALKAAARARAAGAPEGAPSPPLQPQPPAAEPAPAAARASTASERPSSYRASESEVESGGRIPPRLHCRGWW